MDAPSGKNNINLLNTKIRKTNIQIIGLIIHQMCRHSSKCLDNQVVFTFLPSDTIMFLQVQ